MLGISSSYKMNVQPYTPGTMVKFDADPKVYLTGLNIGTNIPAGKKGTISFWCQNEVGASGYKTHFNFGRIFCQSHSNGGNVIMFVRKNSSGYSLTHRQNQSGLDTSLWHIIWSYDLGNNTSLLYYNGNPTGHAPSAITNEDTNLHLLSGNINPTLPVAQVSRDFGDFFYIDDFLDISIASNREMFRSSGGSAVDLGERGEIPFGRPPRVFFRGEPDVWNNGRNRGTSGDWTIQGGSVT